MVTHHCWVVKGAARPLLSPSLAHFSSPTTLDQERKLSLSLSLSSNSNTPSHSCLDSHLCEWDWSEFFVDFNSRSKILLLSTCGTRRRFDFISITLGSWNPSQLGVAWWRLWLVLVRAPEKFVLPLILVETPAWSLWSLGKRGGWKRL